MTTVEQPTPKTSIITLLESNSIVRDTNTGGEWVNNLDEEIILKDGDALTVRQSMIDTTLANSGLIQVLDEERDITISHGMYLTDSGDGTVAGGNAQPAADITFSQPPNCSPSGKNYILQNQVLADKLTRIHWMASTQEGDLIKVRPGATNPGVEAGFPPSFNIVFLPTETPETDWFEYTLESNNGVYVVPTTPVGGFPAFPDNTTSPIPLAGNFDGLHAILFTRPNDGVHEFRIYAYGWSPSGDKPQENDHIGQIEIVEDVNGNHMGYQALWNPNVNNLAGVTEAQYWVWRYGSSDAGGPPTPPQPNVPGYGNFFYFLNFDATSGSYGPSQIYRICTAIYLLVMQKPPKPMLTYGFELSHLEYDDDKNVTKRVNYNDWTALDHKDIDTVYPALFGQQNNKYVPNDTERAELGLPLENTGLDFGKYQYFWQRFEQFPDPRQPTRIVFQPFAFNLAGGMSLPAGIRYDSGADNGGIFNFATRQNPAGAGGRLLKQQIISKAFPAPSSIGCRLSPRIFETKIRIPADKYTYEALAQTITDELNKVNRTIPRFSNNPDLPTQALNSRGWGPSRTLTSSYELSMQMSVGSDTGDGVRLPQFPSEYVYTEDN